MKMPKLYHKIFQYSCVVYILLLLITLILRAIDSPYEDIIISIADYVVYAIIISIICSLFAYYGRILNREKVYHYKVKVEYTPNKGKERVHSVIITTHSGIYVSDTDTLRKLKMHKQLYPEYKRILDNGRLEVLSVEYLGSNYKY